jgi:hypothetical protein
MRNASSIINWLATRINQPAFRSSIASIEGLPEEQTLNTSSLRSNKMLYRRNSSINSNLE